jgi:hypothetical protein
MARFRLTKAVSTAQVRFAAGDVVTDVLPLTVSSDRHWPDLTAAKMHSGMVPLDASASTMKAASPWAGEVLSATILGVDSVGG